jgi:hypothetical protein
MSEHKEPQEKEIVKVQTRLALQREVDRRLGEVVRAAGKRVHLLHDDRAMRENQIRNVLDVAMSTQSIEVVTNFIRYQMGRSGGNQAWLHNNFGQEVVQDLEDRQRIIQRLAAEVCHAVQEANRDQALREVQLRLARLYLGYLNRWFYYGKKRRSEGAFQDIQRAVQETESNV